MAKLEVSVIGCTRLKDTELLSRQDPYVRIKVGSTTSTTKTDTDGGRNPTFNEKFPFSLEPGVTSLHCAVWNSNVFTRDAFIGQATISLATAMAAGHEDNSFPLQDESGKGAGYIRLILCLTHLGEKKKLKDAGAAGGNKTSSPLQGGGGFGYPSAYSGARAYPSAASGDAWNSTEPQPPPPPGSSSSLYGQFPSSVPASNDPFTSGLQRATSDAFAGGVAQPGPPSSPAFGVHVSATPTPPINPSSSSSLGYGGGVPFRPPGLSYPGAGGGQPGQYDRYPTASAPTGSLPHTQSFAPSLPPTQSFAPSLPHTHSFAPSLPHTQSFAPSMPYTHSFGNQQQPPNYYGIPPPAGSVSAYPPSLGGYQPPSSPPQRYPGHDIGRY